MFLIQEIGPRGPVGLAEPLDAKTVKGAVNIAIREADDRTTIEFHDDNTAVIETPAGYQFYIYPLLWEEKYHVISDKMAV